MDNNSHSKIIILPATVERWNDLETLFGRNGACGGCWCVYWRLPRRLFDQGKGEPHKQMLKSLVETGSVPGLLGYLDGKPAGWISLGPRELFPTLNRSRVLKPVDDQRVWSVVCFFVERQHRKKGLATHLLKAGIDYCRQQGAAILEGYPVQPSKPGYPDVYLYTGTVTTFLAEGFVEVARRSETRPIMRKYL